MKIHEVIIMEEKKEKEREREREREQIFIEGNTSKKAVRLKCKI